MKKSLAVFIITLGVVSMSVTEAHDRYWVYFRDKKGSNFDPYSYFDAHAIARRQALGLSIADSSDFPVSESYKKSIETICGKTQLASRWLNAVSADLSEAEIQQIKQLPFVSKLEPVMLSAVTTSEGYSTELTEGESSLLDQQTQSMGRDTLLSHGLNGTGIRIAVFDAGFPGVDKSPVFEHLRANNKIIDTWDFVKNKKFVYAHNSHGTMVLSCIAGIADGKPMGLATNAEFLLARTEQEGEPFSEEENWMAAVEWADQRGADIISSSLGYTYNRYFPEQMNGKASLVAHAANMAAAKGILVVNAMGNDGDNGWHYMGTPADADSIISVGGLNPDDYLRINFSSYGPTVDLRRKPNVSAFGKVIVASPKKLTVSYGTSFSTPLISGFAACALQYKKTKNPMELMHTIEAAGHLYPYFDYAHGYGLPQAYKLLQTKEPEPTISYTLTENGIAVNILTREGYTGPSTNYLYFNFKNKDGVLTHYAVINMNEANRFYISKEEIENVSSVGLWFNGYATECLLSNTNTQPSN